MHCIGSMKAGSVRFQIVWSFIGETHRIAARLDDRYELIAGALSADPQRAIESGRDLRLDTT
ncbi:MAG: hypothetical protein WA376_19585, partial [Terrimicrobiaceae bacterium]